MTACIGYWGHPESRCINLFEDEGGGAPVGEEEAKWKEEFANTGAAQVRQNLLNGAIYNSEAKRLSALEWLRQKERAAELREQAIYSYTQRTFGAAVAAVIVGVLAIIVTLLR